MVGRGIDRHREAVAMAGGTGCYRGSGCNDEKEHKTKERASTQPSSSPVWLSMTPWVLVGWNGWQIHRLGRGRRLTWCHRHE